MTALAKYGTGLLVCGLLAAACFSCKKRSGEAPDFYYRYFPAQTGYWITYTVDSMHHDNGSDTVHFELREETGPSFIDNEGRIAYQLFRYKRTHNSEAWNLTDVWTITRTRSRAERWEENVRLVKLTFPVKQFARWNGNLYNELDEEEYVVQTAHEAHTLNALEFDSVVHVVQKDFQNVIDTIYKEERYASGVGLIFRQYRELSWGGGTIFGVEFYQTITGYGH